MTRDELFRILNFIDAMHRLSHERTRLSGIDPRWNIISYAMRRHLEGKLLTVTSTGIRLGCVPTARQCAGSGI